jgi:hypothetical protein
MHGVKSLPSGISMRHFVKSEKENATCYRVGCYFVLCQTGRSNSNWIVIIEIGFRQVLEKASTKSELGYDNYHSSTYLFAERIWIFCPPLNNRQIK